MKQIALLTLAAFAFSSPAVAAPPKLSGKYLYAWHEFCGANPISGNAITTGIMTFNDATKMASIAAYHATTSHYPLTTESGTGPYSNTTTTVTIDGTVYKAFYGKIANGIAEYVMMTWSGKPTNVSCANQAILLRQ